MTLMPWAAKYALAAWPRTRTGSKSSYVNMSTEPLPPIASIMALALVSPRNLLSDVTFAVTPSATPASSPMTGMFARLAADRPGLSCFGSPMPSTTAETFWVTARVISVFILAKSLLVSTVVTVQPLAWASAVNLSTTSLVAGCWDRYGDTMAIVFAALAEAPPGAALDVADELSPQAARAAAAASAAAAPAKVLLVIMLAGAPSGDGD